MRGRGRGHRFPGREEGVHLRELLGLRARGVLRFQRIRGHVEEQRWVGCPVGPYRLHELPALVDQGVSPLGTVLASEGDGFARIGGCARNLRPQVPSVERALELRPASHFGHRP